MVNIPFEWQHVYVREPHAHATSKGKKLDAQTDCKACANQMPVLQDDLRFAKVKVSPMVTVQCIVQIG
jgi:hypothetical protein